MSIASLAAAEAPDEIAAPLELEAGGEEPFDPDRPARMNARGADADLRTEPKAIAIGEARARVMEDASGVDITEKARRILLRFRDDGVGMGASVAVDMV